MKQLNIHLLEGVDDFQKLTRVLPALVKNQIGVPYYVLYKSDRVPWRGFIFSGDLGFFHKHLLAHGYPGGLIETDRIDVNNGDSYTRRVFIFEPHGLKALALILTDKIRPTIASAENVETEVAGNLKVEYATLQYENAWVEVLDEWDPPKGPWPVMTRDKEGNRVQQTYSLEGVTVPLTTDVPPPEINFYEFPADFKETMNYTIL